MGFLEEAAGAFVALEAEKKLNPEGGVLAEGMAVFAGYEGTKKIEEHFENKAADESPKEE